jgi:hypothetical protein
MKYNQNELKEHSKKKRTQPADMLPSVKKAFNFKNSQTGAHHSR